MGRSKGKKGKEIVGESSSPHPDVASKRRQVVSDSDEEEEEMQDMVTELPEWKSGPLSDQPTEHQATLFKWKMNTLRDKRDAFVCEKEVPEEEFGPFGVHEKFKALGWEAVLSSFDRGNTKLYMDEIEEWVATLRLEMGNSPGQTKLIGKVRGVTVTMSFDTLRRITKFDSKGGNRYHYPHLDDLYFKPHEHPTWNMMVNDLFIAERHPDKLYRDQLKIEPKLLHLIVQQNVIPRRGDKAEVRFSEVPVLYALMHGAPLLSFRYLAMYNIWLSRESHERKIVPHCRLIMALLKQAGVINSQSKGTPRRFGTFSLKNLGYTWTYSDLGNHHQLKTGGLRWRVRKHGESEASGAGREEEMGDSSENEEEYNEEQMRDSGPSMGAMGAGSGQGSWAGYPPHMLEENWAYQGSMNDVIGGARPDTYQGWAEPNRMMYDHVTRVSASNERATKRMYDRQEQWERAHAYAFQSEINDRYEDDRRRRMHDQWHAGQEVVPDPPFVDYATLPPYDGSMSYPTPPVHHSQWVDPRQGQSSQQQQQQQDEGAFGFGQFSEMFTSIFGPPQPRYY